MLRVLSFIAKAGIRNQIEMEKLILYLGKRGYLAIIRNMFTAIFSSAKLPEPDEQIIANMIAQAPGGRFMPGFFKDALGDLFITDEAIYVLNPIDSNMLQVSVIGWGEYEEALQKFCKNIEEGIRTKFDGRRVRGMNFAWKPVSSHHLGYGRYLYPLEDFFEEEYRHEAEKLRVSEPTYSPEDVKAANLLVNTEIRQFMVRLAQVGKMMSKDATKLAKKQDVLQQLLSLDLITEEYLLTCKQNQHTICIVPSKEHLTKEPMNSLRCSVCGRPFPEENLQVIYTLTEKGKRLIDGSLWMSIWITELLKENGVREKSIKWKLEAHGEDIDIMVQDFDSTIFFELKDREFGLGDAYPFIYRITRYGGTLGVVVTMDKVSTDAKKFFEEENRSRRPRIRIRYLEGPENIQKGISEIVKDLALLQVRRVIQHFSIRIGFDLWPIVEHWINTKESS